MIRRILSVFIILFILFVASYSALGYTADEYWNMGYNANENGQYSEAISYYTEYLKLKPNDANAYNNRGFAKHNMQNYRGAIADYNKAIELDPNLSYARENLKLAQKYLNDSITRHTSGEYWNMGYQANENDQYGDAVYYYTEYLKLNPNDANAYNNRGWAKYYLQNYQEAIADYNKAIELDPNLSYARENLKLAQKYLNPDSPQHTADEYWNMGYKANENGQYSDAVYYYTEYLKLNPNNAGAYNNRGFAQYHLKNYEESVADYNKSLELDPGQSHARDNLEIAKKYLHDNSLSSLPPVIVWDSPAVEDYVTGDNTIPLRARVKSGSRIIGIKLMIAGHEYADKDLVIVPSGNETVYKKTISITEKNIPVVVSLSVTSDAGTTTSYRKITVAGEGDAIIVKPVIDKGKRAAIVIGNAKYQNGNTLKNTMNDAKDMAQVLRGYGFEVVEYANLGVKDMRSAINKISSKYKGYNTVLFYYSGHGVQHDGENYLIPVDAAITNETDIEDQCVRLAKVMENLEIAGTKSNIIILDACRDDPFTKGWSRSAGSKGLAKVDATIGTVIAYAAKPGQTASDNPDGKNGLYTGELIKYIKMPGLTLMQVFMKTRLSVSNLTGGKQVPGEYSEMSDDFYF